MASSSEAQLKSDIARLTASINMHKTTLSTQPTTTGYRKNTYVNPNYKPTNKYIRPTITAPVKNPSSTSTPDVKEVVLNGVAFQSSGRSLVRKDLPASSHKTPSSIPGSTPAPKPFTRKSGHLVAANRVYKPKSSRGRRGGPSNRNMTLTNGRRPYQPRRSSKRMRYSDKQCPRFSTTGATIPSLKNKTYSEHILSGHYLLFKLSVIIGSCSHGLTCMYQHDPSKIAICWNFLQDNCPNTADTCNLSHDATPERTPLCLHFLNKGRCTRPNCLYPHVNVGARHGICRDFAVLGYCDKGLDCDKQHVRECPDFAEKGTCSIKGCKLPHVIRANRNRKPASSSADLSVPSVVEPEGESRVQPVTADEAQLGDEYISLTFNESESEEDESEDEDEEDDGEEEEGDDELPVIG